MKKLLTKYYGGEINKIEYINWDPKRIVSNFHSVSGNLGKDHLDEFQSFIQYDMGTQRNNRDDVNEYVRSQMDFEEIMTINSDYFSAPNSTRV